MGERGRPKVNDGVTPYQMPFEPLVLKELAVECDVSQGALAKVTGVSRTTMNLCFNKGYIPNTVEGFCDKIEAFIATRKQAMGWLLERGLKVADIWKPLGKELRNAAPSGVKGRGDATKRGNNLGLAVGLPDEMIIKWEVEMISEEARRHFKLFRNPFVGDVEKSSDIFRSEEHRFIEASMLDAAQHGGFVAIIGEVGSGKTTIRREVMEKLKKDSSVQVIFPQIIDKGRITASSICDAIIMDLSEEKPRIKLEQKTRQVQRLLTDRSRSGYQACLMVEEAHDLTTQTLKYLKRFYELEDGYRKLLGIILIGQTELKNMFNESQHVEMREVIRRVQVAEIRGLHNNLKEYLQLKFRRVGVKELEAVITDTAIEALGARLSSKDSRGRDVSHAYPLLVNNYMARAMNLAAELGEPVVTEEVVNGI